MIDLLLKRYGGLEFLDGMEDEQALKLFLKAIENDMDDRLFHQWAVQLPIMSLKMVEYMSFEEYKNKVTCRNIDLRSDAEIIAEVKALHSKDEVK